MNPPMPPVTVPVLALPHWDPGAGRVQLEMPVGLTLAEIVRGALPSATEADLAGARVCLVTPDASAIIERPNWSRIRPKAGVQVLIRITPAGDNVWRSVLSIAVTIAAVAIGGAYGATFAASIGSSAAVGTALLTAGISIIGQLLLNALIPPVTADGSERRDTYSISGWKNELREDGAVPFVFGTMRYAPPFAARPFTEIVGNDQYVVSMFLIGEGEVDISDIRLGETPIDEFTEVTTEIRRGVEGEAPVTLYPQQRVEESVGVDLTRPLQRNEDGSVKRVEEEYEVEIVDRETGEKTTQTRTRWVDAAAIETPVVRTTGADAAGVSVILAWKSGLVRFNDEGKKRNQSVTIRIEQRLVDAEDWTPVDHLTFTARKAEGFFRQHSWDFETRGRYQIRLTMLNGETDSTNIQQTTTWAALQTIRPEYPLNFNRPLALLAIKIKATHQINGALDNINCLVSRVCPDWDPASGSWVRRITENPASGFRELLQHKANPKAASNSAIGLDQLRDFHEFCSAHGLTWNRVLEETGATLRDVLTEAAAAGRATPRHDGSVWGVVIDRPVRDDLFIDHVNPVSSWDFKWKRSYANPPHAFVVSFIDAANDYKEAQRIVRWPGYTGDIILTEELELPGKVHADEVWREARRRQLETIWRPDSYEATQDGAVRVATRGDSVRLGHYVISRVQAAARVRSVTGKLVELDQAVTMEAGTTYALRFRTYADDADAFGSSVTSMVQTVAGEATVLMVADGGGLPAAGDIVMFGPVGLDSFPAIVREVEITEDQCSILRMVDAAPEIDEILALTEIPAWSSRAGTEMSYDPETFPAPPVPVWADLSSGISETGESDILSYQIRPGSGGATTTRFTVQHRVSGAEEWTSVSFAAAVGGGQLIYAAGTLVELRAQAIGYLGVSGPVSAWTDIVTHTVAASNAPLPAALDAAAVSVVSLLGGALIQFAAGADPATTQVQIYLSSGIYVDPGEDAWGEPIPTSPGTTYSYAIGDTTRSTLITDGGFADPEAWDTDAGWVIAEGAATHTAGISGSLGQDLDLVAARTYRVSFSLSGRTTGSVTVRLSGSVEVAGDPVDTNGDHALALIALTGSTGIAFEATEDFDGSIDTVTVYQQTDACLPQGTHYVFLAPANGDGVLGAIAGPWQVFIP